MSTQSIKNGSTPPTFEELNTEHKKLTKDLSEAQFGQYSDLDARAYLEFKSFANALSQAKTGYVTAGNLETIGQSKYRTYKVGQNEKQGIQTEQILTIFTMAIMFLSHHYHTIGKDNMIKLTEELQKGLDLFLNRYQKSTGSVPWILEALEVKYLLLKSLEQAIH